MDTTLPDTSYTLLNLRRERDSFLSTAIFGNDSRFFDGHFPGKPILPGIAELAAVTETVTTFLAVQGIERFPAGLRRVRFNKLQESGAELEISLILRSDLPEIPFAVSSGSDVICEGFCITDSLENQFIHDSLADNPATTTSICSAFPPTEFIPHRNSMLLLDNISELDTMHCTAGTTPRADWPFVRDNRLPACTCIEIAAQASAALATKLNGSDTKKLGFLVRIRNARWNRQAMEIADPVLVTTETEQFRNDYGVFSAKVETASGFHATMVLQAILVDPRQFGFKGIF